MFEIFASLRLALGLMANGDSEFVRVVALSLELSLAAAVLLSLIHL